MRAVMQSSCVLSQPGEVTVPKKLHAYTSAFKETLRTLVEALIVGTTALLLVMVLVIILLLVFAILMTAYQAHPLFGIAILVVTVTSLCISAQTM
jgi:hypothetical protein